MRKEVLFLGHCGLGDHLITNSLVRKLAEDQKVVVLAKHHNVETCRFMWRDNNNIEVFGIENDTEARAAADMIEKNDRRVIRQGLHRKSGKFEVAPGWDEAFYKESKLPYDLRWSGFKVDRQPSRELGLVKEGSKLVQKFGAGIPSTPYVFVHDDPERGCNIRPELLPKKKPVVRAVPTPQNGEANLFDFWSILMNAEEIHVMESVFAILADHSPELKSKRNCLHLYTRKSIPPRYNLQWERFE